MITPSFLLIYLSIYYFLQDGRTPLYVACEKGHDSTVLLLLQNKANPNLQDQVTSRRMILITMMMIDHNDVEDEIDDDDCDDDDDDDDDDVR